MKTSRDARSHAETTCEPVLFQTCWLRSRGRNGRRREKKKRSVHTWGDGRLRNRIARRQQPGRRQESVRQPGDRGPFSEGAVSVATKADARSIIGEPDPRSFSSEYAGKRRPLRRRLKARNWMPCCSHRAVEEILSSGPGCAVHECKYAVLPTASRLGFGGQSVLLCPSQVRS